jgi:hypothetical protein
MLLKLYYQECGHLAEIGLTSKIHYCVTVSEFQLLKIHNFDICMKYVLDGMIRNTNYELIEYFILNENIDIIKIVRNTRFEYNNIFQNWFKKKKFIDGVKSHNSI